ncbi:hypothetical protein [Gordonia sp. NPDC003376]
MRTGAPDLDDVEELIAADSDGLLHAVAMAGAQVRSVAEAVREGVTAPLADLRPRSVVIVCPSAGPAAAAAALVTSSVATGIDVPIVCTPGLPGWIGPLDVVVVAGVDGGDMVLADAAARALRRRAEVVVAAPIEGPLRDALGGNGIDLSPRIEIDPRFRFAGFVAALLAALTALRAVRFTGSPPDLGDLADALDTEAMAGHPSHDSFHNQAKSLAARLDENAVLWSGDTPATLVLAARAAAVVFSITGQAGATVDLPDLLRGWHRRWSGATSAADSIFHDPELDGPLGEVPPRVLMVTTAAREWQTRRRIATVSTAETVVAGGDLSSTSPVPDGGAGWGGGIEDLTDVPADLTSMLVLMVRIEMAAVYLRLIGAGQ